QRQRGGGRNNAAAGRDSDHHPVREPWRRPAVAADRHRTAARRAIRLAGKFLVLSEGLRPSDSPTGALARRVVGALPPPLKLRRTRRSLGEGGPIAWLARHARSHRGTSVQVSSDRSASAG